MPKKFKGENTKSAVAKARKQEQREEETAKKEKEKEDEYWRDDDKHIAKKQQRKVCIFIKFLNIFQKLQKNCVNYFILVAFVFHKSEFTCIFII